MTRARELADLLTGGQTISTADNTEQIIFKSTDADASAGPLVKMHRESGSPADGDALGRFNFIGENDADEEVTYARIHAKANDVSDGTEDGELLLLTTVAGTNRSRMAVGPSETVFNEDSVDVDFRVESDNNTSAFFVKGDDGKVGINTTAPNLQTSINFDTSAVAGLGLHDTNSGNLGGMLQFYSGSGQGTLRANIMNANNAGVHFAVGTGGSVVFTQNSYVAANALDDYEEGTFTPSFAGGITGSSYGDQNGTYVKIGQLVFFAIELDVTNGQASTNGNQILIDNIPFVSAASSPMVHSQGGAWVTFNNNFYNVDTGPYLQIPTNTNQIKLYRGAGNALAGTDSGVAAQNDFHIAGCYRTA